MGEPGGMEEKYIVHWGLRENTRVSEVQYCDTSPGKRGGVNVLRGHFWSKTTLHARVIAQIFWLSRNEKGDLWQLEEAVDNQNRV